MIVRAFGAPSFDQFWRYWNPVYGYLYYRCYRPLRRFFPRAVCVLLTFAASGFLLHDLPFGWWIRLIRSIETGRIPVPFVTLWFCLMGVLTLVSRALGWNMSSLTLFPNNQEHFTALGIPATIITVGAALAPSVLTACRTGVEHILEHINGSSELTPDDCFPGDAHSVSPEASLLRVA